MPLKEFKNYNEYWESRSSLPLLYRFKYVANDLPNIGRVLDVGCGDGTFLKYLKTKKPDLTIMGLDISPVSIKRLKEAEILGFVHDVSANELPRSIKADYVVIMEVLEHFENPEFVLKSLLSTGATRYYVTIPNLGYIEHRLRLAIAGKMPITSIILHIREHLRFWTVSDFRHWADQMGFNVLAVKGQRGVPGFWRVFPSVFASQVIYTLEIK